MASPRPLLAPDPRRDSTADVPWAPGYTGPRTITRTTYRPLAAGSSPSTGRALSPEAQAALERYAEALADEDARRWDLQNDRADRQLGLNEEQVRSAIEEAKQRLAENRRQFDLTFGEGQRQYDLTRGDRRYEFDQTQGLNRDRFGLDILRTGASLRGPLDAFQGAAFARGAGGLGSYLTPLRNGGTSYYGGGTATTANPTPLTLGTMANEIAPGAGAPSTAAAGVQPEGAQVDQYGRPVLAPEWQQRLADIDAVAKRGLANLGQGALENLSQSELGTFKSGLAYLGRSPDDELEMYKRSRAGQGSARGA